MRQKAMITVVAVVALCVAIPATQASGQGPYDQPPKVVPKRKSKAKKGKIKAGTAMCGTGTCTLKGVAKAKINGKSYKARVKPATIPAGGSVKIIIRLSKAGKAAIRKPPRKGRVKFTFTVMSSNGLVATSRGKMKIKGA